MIPILHNGERWHDIHKARAKATDNNLKTFDDYDLTIFLNQYKSWKLNYRQSYRTQNKNRNKRINNKQEKRQLED